MKKLTFLAAAIFALAALISFNFSFNNVSADNGLAVGATLENFKLTDSGGATKSLDELKGKNGSILVFLSVQCPVVKAYNERIVKLAADYQAMGINVIGINSNSTETADKVKTHAAENYKFPVLIDKDNVIADKLGANVTPETFYFDAKNVLLYRGAIDNNKAGDSVTVNYLGDAVAAGLSGKAVAKTSANAFGCSIKRAAKN